MKCPRDSDILDLVSGKLDPERQQQLQEHITACPTCAETFAELQASFTALDAWHLGPTAVDVSDAVLERADNVEQQRPATWIAPWRRPLRIAASVVLSAGLGIAAGALVPIQSSTAEPPSAEQVAESLGLTSFATDSDTGLLAALDVTETGSNEEGGTP